jgi:hypothetical protein
MGLHGHVVLVVNLGAWWKQHFLDCGPANREDGVAAPGDGEVAGGVREAGVLESVADNGERESCD